MLLIISIDLPDENPADSVILMFQVSGQPAKWSGLYALGFGLILLLWSGKLGYNVFFSRGRNNKKGLESPSTSSSEDQPSKPYNSEVKINGRGAP